MAGVKPDMKHEVSKQWIDKAQAGDAMAFRQIVLHYAKAVNALAYRYTKDAHLAEDIAQDTFIKAHQALNRYQTEAKFSTWLLRITTNTSIDYLRKANRQMAVSLDCEDGQIDVPVASGEDQVVLQDALDHAMNRLTDVERLAITMKHHQGYSIAETAAKLNLNDNACKQTIFRAVRKLRQQLLTEVSA